MFKSRSRGFCFLLSVFCLLPASLYAQEAAVQAAPQAATAQAPAGITPGSLTPAQRQAAESLSSAQQQAVQAELSKTGGQLTPEAIEALKKSPEFKDIKPEEVQKGKELIEKKDSVTTKPTLPEGEGSLFDRYISDTSPLEVSTRLRPFGYDLFTGVSLAPPQDMPVASDYVVGPGDEISILIWGRLTGQYTLVVSRDGTIQFPNIGPLSVAGMNFEELKKFLTRQAKNIVGAEINVTMGRLRSIQVFVLGEVKKPGAYTVSAMSTLTNALMASGGPTLIGSLRKVELKRNSNKTATTMDFYDLLLKGDKSKDMRLQSGDVIFVPTVGPLVGVAGNVKRPAIYELKDVSDLSGILDLAGGMIPTAYTQQIQVERVEKNERRIIVDINAMGSDVAKTFRLQDADLVKVFSIVDRDGNVVYLHGNVKRPGKYELKSGMRVKDVIKDETELLQETHFDYGLVKRLVPPTLEVKLLPFNLGNLLFKASQEDNIELAPHDSIYIFSEWFFKDRPTVGIAGEVRKGGTFELEENLTIKDFILKAGGLTKDASYDEFELYRTDRRTKEVTLLKFNLSKAMEGNGSHNIKLQDLDRVVIHSIWETVPKQYVTITGDVNKPGQYTHAANMTVRDLIFAAGNLLESAYLDDTELASHTVKDGNISLINYQTINLRKALAGDPAHNISLNPYDTLLVKRITNWKEEKYIEVKGEVKFPGKYIVKKGERLSSLIERAGGFTDRAYFRGAMFTRESVRELQQKNLNDSIDRLEQQMLSQAAISAQTAISPEDAAQQKAVAEQQRAIIAKMRAAKSQGRMVTRVDALDKFKGSLYDIEFEDGDSLIVPAQPNSIQVMGSVYNSTAFIYEPDASISRFIEKAGGTTRYADDKELFVLKVDGSAIARRQSGMFFMSSRLEPGDTIVVPEKVERIAWMKEIKDLTQILYQIAVTAGVLIVAF